MKKTLNSENFFLIPKSLLLEGDFGKACVFGVILDFFNDRNFNTGEIITNKRIAEILNRKSSNTISHYINELAKDGWINLQFLEKNYRKVYVNWCKLK